MKILLVDDEQEFVSALSERLILRGIEADYACDGPEALLKVKAIPYDLAVLDVKMPNLSGIDLKRDLKAIRPEMKFIFCTGHGSEQDYRAGTADDSPYLVKPLHIDELMAKIKEVLGISSPSST